MQGGDLVCSGVECADDVRCGRVLCSGELYERRDVPGGHVLPRGVGGGDHVPGWELVCRAGGCAERL